MDGELRLALPCASLPCFRRRRTLPCLVLAGLWLSWTHTALELCILSTLLAFGFTCSEYGVEEEKKTETERERERGKGGGAEPGRESAKRAR